MFGKRKSSIKKAYDRENQRPVIHCSICTGEQVAGFKQVHTGAFEEVMLIRNPKDLEQFLQMYDLEPSAVTKEY